MGTAYRGLLARLETTRTLGVSLGLERVRAALERLGSPHERLRAVHIAGTNGKGSTAAMTEAILRAAGLRTGLFTSPHLSRFTERIRIDGQEIDGAELARLDERVVATTVPLTYFEVSAVLALLAMAEAEVDVAVLETGLGGRLDATNVCVPVATAITSIDFDHMEMLGGTLSAIAGEKAGICKAGVPLFFGSLAAEAEAEIVRVAAAVGAPVRRVTPLAEAGASTLALGGSHQRANAALAVALATEAARAAGRSLAPEAVNAGLSGVVWPGRMERLAPDVLIDAAHNAEGARALVAALPPARPRALVTSVVRGKQLEQMLATLLPHFDCVAFTRSTSERSLFAEELVECAARVSPAAVGSRLLVPDPLSALARARQIVAPGGLCVVAGSIFLVGQIRAHLRAERIDPLPGGDPMP